MILKLKCITSCLFGDDRRQALRHFQQKVPGGQVSPLLWKSSQRMNTEAIFQQISVKQVTRLGLSLDEDRTYVKYYMGDTGLLILECGTFPIEVKSNDKYTICSLIRFNESLCQRIGGCYVIHPRNLCVKEGMVCLPVWPPVYDTLQEHKLAPVEQKVSRMNLFYKCGLKQESHPLADSVSCRTLIYRKSN